ncbi:MAG: hypothetical protein CSA29_01015 [Desulfobacterales bacterium]|nr:MAG: hypothetical protein CSA29_01015 [Desulfobacterales bacterium]
MIITCEQCSTRFTLDDAMLQPQGSKVRCSQCKHIFTAFPSGSEAENEAEALEMDFSEDPSIDFDDQQINSQEFDGDDLQFDDMEFDDAPSFDPPDDSGIDFESPQNEEFDSNLELDTFEAQDISFIDADDELELDIAGPSPLAENELAPALEETMLDHGDETFTLADGELELDLELEPLDLDIEDIETIEDALQNPDSPPLKDTESDGDESSLTAVNRLELDDVDDGLKLAFEDDPDTDFKLEASSDNNDDATLNRLDDSGELGDLEDMNVSMDIDDDFDIAPAPLEETESQLELVSDTDETSDFFVKENAGDLKAPDNPGEKFEEYDAILDDDPDSGEVIPDPELDEATLDTPLDTNDASKTAEPQSEDESILTGPAATDSNKAKKKKKAGLSAPVKTLFLLFLLVIVAYVTSLKMGANIPFLSNINIPYVTDALKPPPKVTQQLKPVPNEPSINGRFVSNDSAGELFIVTGRIDNPSQIPYSNIKVKGTLLDNTKAKVVTQAAYCGNIIPEGTLKKGNISDITKQLGNKNGLQNANMNVAPGKSVPFMIVFSNLPKNLTNFTVEVTHFRTPLQSN